MSPFACRRESNEACYDKNRPNFVPTPEKTRALTTFLRGCGASPGVQDEYVLDKRRSPPSEFDYRRLPTSYVVEPLVNDPECRPSQHVLTRSAAAVELVFFALDHLPTATVAYVCSRRGADDLAENDEFFNAAARLVLTYAGYRLVAVVEPGEAAPSRVTRFSTVVEWPELAAVRAEAPGAAVFERPPPIAVPSIDIATVLHQVHCLHPYSTPSDYRPGWLANKPAVLLADLRTHAERCGYTLDLAAAEAAGVVFRGSFLPPLGEWIALACESTQHSTQRSFGGDVPTLIPQESTETRQFRQLAADLRDWLVAKPPPREVVLSRSGLVPFLTSDAVSRAYACNPPTAAHVRHAVEVFGATHSLRCSSSPARNNGATVVRLAVVGQPRPRSAAPPTPDDDLEADVFSRDKRLVDDLYAWLCHRGRAEVSCADLMPFYAAFPAYRKGGGQGSGIKHAITRFGLHRLLWLEKKSGGDARIIRLDLPRPPCEDEDDQHSSTPASSDDGELVCQTSYAKLASPPRLPLSRRLQSAQKRVHLVVHDHEVVSGKPLPLRQLTDAFRVMHGTDIDPPETLGFSSLADFLRAAPRLCCCAENDEPAVRCDPPPPELGFVRDLRDHVAAFVAAYPEGVTFAQLKDRVKLFGQERHTSVRFLRGGILGVINCVLVPSVVVQLEPNGLFYPAQLIHQHHKPLHLPIGGPRQISAVSAPSPVGFFSSKEVGCEDGRRQSLDPPRHDMFGGPSLLAGLFDATAKSAWPLDRGDAPLVTPESSLYDRQISI